MTFRFRQLFAVLTLMLASTASWAASDCCDDGGCCEEVAMPCCE